MSEPLISPATYDAIEEFRCSLSTIAGLASAKGANALHEISCTALAGIERLKLMSMPSASESSWRPMWELPQVQERTEMLFRREWAGRDGKVRATHEVLWLWPDGVVSDSTESTIEGEDMPTHWRSL